LAHCSSWTCDDCLPGLKTRQVDFTNAFCQAEQKDPLFIELPPHYQIKGMEHLDIVLSLQKSLYGTVTAPKQFYEHLKIGMENKVLLQVNLTCLFIHL
jgi:hypothetical protein